MHLLCTLHTSKACTTVEPEFHRSGIRTINKMAVTNEWRIVHRTLTSNAFHSLFPFHFWELHKPSISRPMFSDHCIPPCLTVSILILGLQIYCMHIQMRVSLDTTMGLFIEQLIKNRNVCVAIKIFPYYYFWFIKEISELPAQALNAAQCMACPYYHELLVQWIINTKHVTLQNGATMIFSKADKELTIQISTWMKLHRICSLQALWPYQFIIYYISYRCVFPGIFVQHRYLL